MATTETFQETTLTPEMHEITLPKLGQCGRTPDVHFYDNKIVGGKPASLHGWPWIAALGFKVS
jgi:hypothetical protein